MTDCGQYNAAIVTDYRALSTPHLQTVRSGSVSSTESPSVIAARQAHGTCGIGLKCKKAFFGPENDILKEQHYLGHILDCVIF